MDNLSETDTESDEARIVEDAYTEVPKHAPKCYRLPDAKQASPLDQKRSKVFTELNQTFRFEGGRETSVTIFFPDEECEIGLQQRLKVIVAANLDERPIQLQITPVDAAGQTLGLCSKPKRDHDTVMKVHNELFSKGRSEADITFYCKGVSSLCGGCGRKSPSKVQLKVECAFVNQTIQIGLSAPFLIKANRRKQRTNPRYHMIPELTPLKSIRTQQNVPDGTQDVIVSTQRYQHQYTMPSQPHTTALMAEVKQQPPPDNSCNPNNAHTNSHSGHTNNSAINNNSNTHEYNMHAKAGPQPYSHHGDPQVFSPRALRLHGRNRSSSFSEFEAGPTIKREKNPEPLDWDNSLEPVTTRYHARAQEIPSSPFANDNTNLRQQEQFRGMDKEFPLQQVKREQPPPIWVPYSPKADPFPGTNSHMKLNQQICGHETYAPRTQQFSQPRVQKQFANSLARTCSGNRQPSPTELSGESFAITIQNKQVREAVPFGYSPSDRPARKFPERALLPASKHQYSDQPVPMEYEDHPSEHAPLKFNSEPSSRKRTRSGDRVESRSESPPYSRRKYSGDYENPRGQPGVIEIVDDDDANLLPSARQLILELETRGSEKNSTTSSFSFSPRPRHSLLNLLAPTDSFGPPLANFQKEQNVGISQHNGSSNTNGHRYTSNSHPEPVPLDGTHGYNVGNHSSSSPKYFHKSY